MKTETLPLSSIGLQHRTNYGKLTLLQLIERIADSGDPGALKELHDEREIFYDQQKNTIHLAEYLAVLMNSRLAKFCCGGDSQVIEDAYNMTLDKFFNFPTRQASSQQEDPQGPNCRYYFNAFVKCTKKKLKENPPANAIEADIISAIMARGEEQQAEDKRLRFCGTVKFSGSIRKRIKDTILPIIDRIVDTLDLDGKNFEISAVNLGAASALDVGVTVTGLSADVPIFIAMLSEALQISVSNDFVAAYVRDDVTNILLSASSTNMLQLTWYVPGRAYFKGGDRVLFTSTATNASTLTLNAEF